MSVDKDKCQRNNTGGGKVMQEEHRDELVGLIEEYDPRVPEKFLGDLKVRQKIAEIEEYFEITGFYGGSETAWLIDELKAYMEEKNKVNEKYHELWLYHQEYATCNVICRTKDACKKAITKNVANVWIADRPFLADVLQAIDKPEVK
jgi:hypothetical protein